MRDLVRRRRCEPAPHSTGDRDAARAEHCRESLAGRDRGVGSRRPVVRVRVPAVDGERAERADVALLRVDRLPRGKEAQRLVGMVVDEERAADVVHAGGDDGVGERGERRERRVAVRGLGVLVDDVLGGGEQRIAASDDDEIAGGIGEHSGREAMVGTEQVDRGRRGQELHRRSRGEREIVAEAGQRAERAVDCDARVDRGDDRGELLRQRVTRSRLSRALDRANEQAGHAPGRPQRRAHLGRGVGGGVRGRGPERGQQEDRARRAGDAGEREAHRRASGHVTPIRASRKRASCQRWASAITARFPLE